MMQRGKKSRPKPAGLSTLLNRNPQPTFLDLKDIHSDDFKGAPDLTPSPFRLRKQETEYRIQTLRDRGRNWIPTRRKERIVRDWVASITSSFRLTEDQLLQRSGFDDIVTLFLEYHWRRFVLGPGDALALVGLTLRHSLCSRTYSRRTKPAKKACRRSHKRQVVNTETDLITTVTHREDMMSHQPFCHVPEQVWPRRDDQKPNKRPRVEGPSDYWSGGHNTGSANPHDRSHFPSAANTGWSQIAPPRSRRGQQQTYRNPTQQPHIAHAYNPPPYLNPGYPRPSHHRKQHTAPPLPPPPPVSLPERSGPAVRRAKHQEATPQYRHHGPGPSHPTESHHGSHTRHHAEISGRAFPIVVTRNPYPEPPPRKPDLQIGRVRRAQEAGHDQKRRAQLLELEQSVKARQDIEQALSQLPQASMPMWVPPKAVVDPTKNIPARSLPKFTKSTKKRRDQDELQPLDLKQRAVLCPPSVTPDLPSPKSSTDTVETSETATTLLDDDRTAAASPSLDSVTGSLGKSKGQEDVGQANPIEATLAIQGIEGVMTNPAPEPQAAVGDDPPASMLETQASVEPISEPHVGTEDTPVEPGPAPQAMEADRMVEPTLQPQVAAESLEVRHNLPPRLRLSRSVYQTKQGAPEVVELATPPNASQPDEASPDGLRPPLPQVSTPDDRPFPFPAAPRPIDIAPPEGLTQMQLDEDKPCHLQLKVTGMKLVASFHLLTSNEPPPHGFPHLKQRPILDQTVPPIVSNHTPPEPEVSPYRSLQQLHTYPPIWAETRQEVCETFEWFRSYQGGVYFSHDIVRGYLLSAFGAKRDIFAHQGRLIISHGGGRAESIHKERGRYVLRGAEDQRSDDKSVRALLKTYRDRRPIALVIDDRYAQFPYDLGSKGVTYAVLGFYMIVQAWAEVQLDPSSGRNIVKYKFAFQWCEGQGEPWWLSESGKADIVSFSEDAVPLKVSEERPLRERRPTAVVTGACPQCDEESPQVYTQGWACLQPTCIRFWQLGRTNAAPGDPCVFLPEVLTYHEGFLELREPCPLPIGFETLRPPPVKERADGITTSRHFTRGFHCDKCGRLSCRVEWQKWKCNTPGCDKAFIVNAKVREAKEFWSQPITTRYLTAELDPSAGVRRLPSRSLFDNGGNHVGLVDTFVLPEQRGFLHHIQPPGPHSRLEANTIFKKYQEQANDGSLVFKRWPMRAHKCRGALLTNYFSHNAGEPYHYVGGTDNTVPFDQAPSAVVDARALIQRRISQALGRGAEFNEVLTAAYMEKQKMAFHSDEEVGLGPLVAGLSLGSPAFMHFRLQRKHDRTGERKGILMSFILRHGDVFVMDGIGVQKFYEHTVVPTNFRIAATARSINAPKPSMHAIGQPKPISCSHVPAAPIVSVKVKVEPSPDIAIPPLELMCGGLTMAELASQLDA